MIRGGRWKLEIRGSLKCLIRNLGGVMSHSFFGISTCVPQNVLFAICVPFILQSRLKCILSNLDHDRKGKRL